MNAVELVLMLVTALGVGWFFAGPADPVTTPPTVLVVPHVGCDRYPGRSIHSGGRG